jgi:two-component system OmpR family sensor kinase
MRLSLRTRLTVWYSIALFATLIIFAAVVIWQQGRIGIRRVDRELEESVGTLWNVLSDELAETSDPHAAAVEALHTLAMPGHPAAILDGFGNVLAAEWNGLAADDVRSRAREGRRVWTAESPDSAWRVMAMPRSVGTHSFALVVGSQLADAYRERREAQQAMWIGIPIALVLAGAGGLWLATVGLRPITKMAQRASQLAPTGLDDLGESERQDELGQLARAFNGLVGRLREALQTQRQFMADASHELRTPLSVVQSAADVALGREERSASEYRETLGIVRTQARRLGHLVDDMLVLARADAGGYPLRRVDLYLDELLTECGRTVDVLARERSIAVEICSPQDVSFVGDEDLLRRMLLNIVQNAVQNTRTGGVVRLTLTPNGHDVAIRVQDQGQGVPDGDAARIFDRFVQLDASRRNGGAGLGLPIARWIAESHGGTLDLESSSAAGSTFRIVLPAD